MKTNRRVRKEPVGVSRVSAYRTVLLLLAVLLLWAFCARPARAAGYWTVMELEGSAVSIRHSGEKPRAIWKGDNLPPGTFVQVRANSRVVFRSGDDIEIIPAGQSRLLRSTNAQGYSSPAFESLDSAQEEGWTEPVSESAPGDSAVSDSGKAAGLATSLPASQPPSSLPARGHRDDEQGGISQSDRSTPARRKPASEPGPASPNEARDIYRRRLSDLVARSRAEATELGGSRGPLSSSSSNPASSSTPGSSSDAVPGTASPETRDIGGSPGRREVRILGYVPPQIQQRAESAERSGTGLAGEPEGEVGPGMEAAGSRSDEVAAGTGRRGEDTTDQGGWREAPRFRSSAEALAVLRGERLPESGLEGDSGTADKEEGRKPDETISSSRSVRSSYLRDIAPPPQQAKPGSERTGVPTGQGRARAGRDAAGAGTGKGRLGIVWPASGVAMVAAPTSVRLAWTPGVEPRVLSFRTGEIELLRAPLGPADREVALPELGVLTEPGGEYTLAVEWGDADGGRATAEADFRLLSDPRRERMRQDLYYLYEALGPLWNHREGLMLRASVFAEFDCQSEAAELLLRYVALAPEDREVYVLLHHLLRASSQPDRAAAALALAGR